MAAQFTARPQDGDSYRSYTFRVKWDGRYVAGITRVGALTRSTTVIEHRDGSDANTVHKSPGRTDYDAITLERGVTHDAEFEQWANAVGSSGSGPGATTSLPGFRKDVDIEIYNPAGELALAYRVFRCWVSQFQALPELDATGNAVAFETIRLENEGWTRLHDVAETDLAEPEPDSQEGIHVTAEETEFPPSLGSVARRELAVNGLTQFTQLTDRSEGELLSIHGVGPKAIRILREELRSRGLQLRDG